MAFFNVTPVGDVFKKFSSDLSAFSYSATLASVFNACGGVIELAVILGVALSTYYPLVGIVLFSGLLYGLSALLDLPVHRQFSRIAPVYSAPLTSLYSEVMKGGVLIRTFGCNEYYIGRISTCLDLGSQLQFTRSGVSWSRSLAEGLISNSAENLCNFRRGVTMITQKAEFFAGTLRFNLDSEGRHSDEELLRYCNTLGLTMLFDSMSDSAQDSEDSDSAATPQDPRPRTCLDYKIESHSKNLTAGQS
ncbi:hypothetical protein EV182_002342 [Spiromyces aspiralis]|uniref:Uncharacterized protein n=1 Tax=Spiromyces aspiralis TaxID=68401 RepID=A0ACC1HW33_9FUNG|nr:hypothetical protein EV182_002342 [Spiromyces aspiralis]